jgi:hypothetical protein
MGVGGRVKKRGGQGCWLGGGDGGGGGRVKKRGGQGCWLGGEMGVGGRVKKRGERRLMGGRWLSSINLWPLCGLVLRSHDKYVQLFGNFALQGRKYHHRVKASLHFVWGCGGRGKLAQYR